MSKSFKKITSQKPSVYGISYLSLIPLYAIFFWLMPDQNLKLNGHEPGFISSLYFSLITITTLGYGDITPIGPVSQLVTASESILGIILIGLFLNSLSHQHGLEVQEFEKKKQLEKEEKLAKDRFTAFNQIVDAKIDRYFTYIIPVTTPISNRKSPTINENFSFSDMRDLFKATLRLTDHHFTPAIEYYFKSLNDLTNSLEDLVKYGYAQHWPALENLCLEFIYSSKNLDFSDFILNQPKTMLGDKTGSEFDAEMIKNHEGELQFLSSNTKNAYVALYIQIRSGIDFEKKYRQLAAQIKNC
ncbi:potassium channel family protein [Comamonas testosteroni]|uniref:potassium channel family protein n=1 Tax=Comamonas testosteroni TaxID=285 RepID=UPI0038998BD3